MPAADAQPASPEETAAETLQASEALVEATTSEMPFPESVEEAVPALVAELVADAPTLLAEAVEAEIDAIEAAVEQAGEIVEAVLDDNIAAIEAVVDSNAEMLAAMVERETPPRPARRAKSKGGAARPKASGSPSIALADARASASAIQQHVIAAAENGARLLEGSGEMAKANVEALLASSDITVSGIEALGRETVEFGRKSFNDASSAWKRLAASGSLADLVKLQSHYACLGFESLVAESSKLCGAVLTLSEEAALPIARRYSATIEQVRSYRR
jgi:phasin family protein